MFFIVAAVAVELFFRLARARGRNARKIMPFAGGVAGLVIGATLPLQRSLIDPTFDIAPTAILLITIIGVLLGALAGLLGGRFITMSNALAPETKEA
jgi:uncharacterized membrane protein YcaP (DUF421 family)